MEKSVNLKKDIYFQPGLTTHSIKMSVEDFIKIEKPLLNNFTKLTETIPTVTINRFSQGAFKVIEKSILPLIGICFLADWYSTNNFM